MALMVRKRTWLFALALYQREPQNRYSHHDTSTEGEDLHAIQTHRVLLGYRVPAR